MYGEHQTLNVNLLIVSRRELVGKTTILILAAGSGVARSVKLPSFVGNDSIYFIGH